MSDFYEANNYFELVNKIQLESHEKYAYYIV